MPSLLHRTSQGAHYDSAGNVTAKSYFDTVDAVDARISTRATARSDNFDTGNETKVHQMIRNPRRQVELLQDSVLTFFEVGKSGNPDISEVENHFQFHLRL
jgi:hypothetical protein